jgi:predicted DNA-binding transcriptional regulator YafY
MIAPESATRIKLLKIWEILNQETDEEHPMSSLDLLARLKEWGISINRKTLYNDIAVLNQCGYEVLCHRSRNNEYYVMDRKFDVPEVKILMDAVKAANFITPSKTDVLIDKLGQLAGSKRAEVLKSNIIQFNTIKGNNEAILYSVNEITSAILHHRKISFLYFTRDITYKPVYKKDKENPDENRVYIVNPVATVYSDDRYYLICYDDKHGNLVQYRVDRMDQTKMLNEEITPSQESGTEELIKHRSSLVRMFGGRMETVTFEGSASVVEAVFDKFGHNVKISENGDGKIEFSVTVQVGKPFLLWVIGFEKDLKVTSPSSVVEEIKALLAESTENYR